MNGKIRRNFNREKPSPFLLVVEKERLDIELFVEPKESSKGLRVRGVKALYR
ncbi:hypothetical protein ALT721_1310073 [Alteromonas alvinellae]